MDGTAYNIDCIDIYDIPSIIDIVEDCSVNYNGCQEDPMDDPADYCFRDISKLRF